MQYVPVPQMLAVELLEPPAQKYPAWHEPDTAVKPAVAQYAPAVQLCTTPPAMQNVPAPH